MKTYLNLTLKVSLSIFLASAFTFSLLCAGFTVSHDFTHLYSEIAFSEACAIENTFATLTSNVIQICAFDKLTFIIASLSEGTMLPYTPNLATLSRAPPYSLIQTRFIENS